MENELYRIKTEIYQGGSDQSHPTHQDEASAHSSPYQSPLMKSPVLGKIEKFRAVFSKHVGDVIERDKKVKLLKSCLTGVTRKIDKHFGEFRASSSDEVPNFEWDYVIVFKNPNYGKDKKRTVDRFTAAEHFEECVEGEIGEKYNDSHKHKTYEKEAFLKVFDKLPEFKPDEYANARNRELRDSIKRRDHGGNIDLRNGFWVQCHEFPQDYLTLIRNLVQTKIALHLSLKTKLLMSDNGKYIYLTILAEDEAIYNEAEKRKISLELDIGMLDLASLEPCDENFRPFRLLHKDNQTQQLFDEIKPIFSEMLNISEDDDKEREELLDAAPSITALHWEAYREYLRNIRKGVDQLLKNNYDKQIKMHIFKKVMKLAIENTNHLFTATPLFNLWDRLKFQRPIPPYMPFVRKDRKNKHSLHHFWKTHQINERGTRSIFHSRDRIKLTYSLIQSQINLDKLERYGLIQAHFPLHDYWDFEGREVIGNSSSFQYLQDQRLYTRIINVLSQENDKVLGLKNCWSKKLFRLDLPINYIRSYFGEKIALYFSFLRFYTKWLIFATILGTITGVARWFVTIHDDFYDEVSAFYCIGIMIWATLFIEFWKREQASRAIEWGQTDFEQEEAVRPEFKGKLIRSPIDDNPNELYYSTQARFKRLVISTGISFGLLFIVFVIVSIILTHQSRLEDFKAQHNFLIIFGKDFSPDLASALIGIQILIFNQIYKKISYYLVEFENWRTQSEFENSMIMKRFTFEFVNAYISIFYTAFFKTYIEGCDIVTPNGVTPNVIGGDCMSELTNELGTIYLILFSENVLRMLYDKYKKRYIKEYKTNPRIHAQVFDIESLRTDLDAQMKCKTYHSEGGVDGTYEDFQELIVQYGFVTLFAVAFPIAPMLTLMTNFLEMFLDRDKLLNKMRRPLPQGAKNIGKWFDVVKIITGIAILTNSGILCFTIHAFVDWPIFDGNPFVPFILMLGGLYWLRKVVSESVPEIPRNYQLVIKRHKCIIDRTLRGKKPIKKRTDGKMEYLDTSIKGVKRY